MSIMVKKVDEVASELSTLSSAKLHDELKASLLVTAEHLVRMAAIIRLLEERGEDLSDLRFALLGYLRRIACGQLLPEAVVRFQGAPLLLNKIMMLPLPDQEKIISQETIRVTMIDGERTDVRTVPPLLLSREEIHQVFASDHIRSDAEQASYVKARAGSERQRRSTRTDVQIDMKRGGALVNGAFISRAELMSILSKLM